jgi:hypothetical protein
MEVQKVVFKTILFSYRADHLQKTELAQQLSGGHVVLQIL